MVYLVRCQKFAFATYTTKPPRIFLPSLVVAPLCVQAKQWPKLRASRTAGDWPCNTLGYCLAAAALVVVFAVAVVVLVVVAVAAVSHF